jgi:hypothetical protein
VVGEAGIGKTRLLQEFARQVKHRIGLICWGNCFPGEQELPYQPFIEALRSVLGQLDPVRLKGLPTIWLHEVTRLVPELAEHVSPCRLSRHCRPSRRRTASTRASPNSSSMSLLNLRSPTSSL